MSPHKNVLFIIADDLGKYLGAYGCRSVKTPNCDALAAGPGGVRFDLAFASTASCSGSRSTIYTGLHTHENGQYGLAQLKTHFQTFYHIDSIPTVFNKAGYLTGIIGKVHVGDRPVYPWTVFDEDNSRDVALLADRCEGFFARAQASDQPFNLIVGFHDPHRDRSRGGFANDSGPFDPRVTDISVTEEEVEIPDWLTDCPELRKEMAEYYRAIHRFDQGVGFVLEALRRKGLDQDTLVIVTSDNGPPFINSKTTLYESGSCLPFIVHHPDLHAKGTSGVVNPNLVSWIDIFPTMLDFCGLDLELRENKESPPRRGRSILPILDRADIVPEHEWQHHVFGSHTFHQRENYWPTRVIRARRFKYHRNVAWRLDFPFATDLYASLSFEGIRNMPKPVYLGKRRLKDYIFRPAEELFDIESDPSEIVNLVGEPKYEAILSDLRSKLEEWQHVTEDPWLYKDGHSVKSLEVWVTEEMDMPDRLDFDPDHPGVNDGPGVLRVKPDLYGTRGSGTYGPRVERANGH